MTSHTYDPAYYYFTACADGEKVDRSSRFRRAQSTSEMISMMQDCCLYEVTGYAEGDFGDCWAKTIREPTEDDFERWSDEYGLPSDCFRVKPPGTHPGGGFYWVDLSIPVYVPVYKLPEE